MKLKMKPLFIFIMLFIAAPAFSYTNKEYYVFWLENFLFKKIEQRVKEKETQFFIIEHLKSKKENFEYLYNRIINLRQAEFSRPEKYFRYNLIESKVTLGKKIKSSLFKKLEKIEKHFGVDKDILLAIWANETFYGKVLPNIDGLFVLSILSFSSEKKHFYLNEFFSLLSIIEKSNLPLKQFKTSISGALGQPQFLPSSLIDFGVDFNGDSFIDIWNSPIDSLASIANFLSKNGWKKSPDWGFEVNKPKGISCFLEGPDHSRSLRQWEKLGIKRVSNNPFPEMEQTKSYSLLLPAGTYGPTFLVNQNFYAIKSYNNSDLYALSVAFLSDKIKYKNHSFYNRWQKTKSHKKPEIIAIQTELAKNFDVGGIDGLIGYKTRRAIGLYQKKRSWKETCWLPL
jgi:lytic murein transglycosylase